MRVFDSFKQLIAMAALSGCVSAGPDIGALDLSSSQALSTSELTRVFQQACLMGNRTSLGGDEFAMGLIGWSLADDVLLEQNGLEALRKTVLAVPGGGARYSGTQELYAMTSGEMTIVLGHEQDFARTKHVTSRCSVYAPGELLAECESLGRLVGKAPDKNLNFPSSKARFISWDVKTGNRAAVVGCEHAPQSRLMPYEGIVLSLTIDEQATTSQPVSDAARR